MSKITEKGTIISSLAGFYDVKLPDQTVRTRAAGVFRKKKEKPVVGDHVLVELDGDNTNYLTEIFPRKNRLVRPPLANVDEIILVISAVEPDFSLNLLDRFLIFFASQDIKVNIYLSKSDLVNPDKLEEINEFLHYYEDIGYRLLKKNGEPKLAEIINQDEIFVLAGQSGAGKSTLLNSIKKDANQETAPISNSLNRGKHTTRMTTLFMYGAGFIADTPGFSAIDIHQIKINELADSFIEFADNAHGCKFRGCQHINEPGCAIKDLVEKGVILPSRYDNYLSMRDEIQNNKLPEYMK